MKSPATYWNPFNESAVTVIRKRHIPLAGAYNFRDLGGYRTRSGGFTKWGRVLRADSPHRLTRQDVHSLLDQGLGTVIDLRSANELDGAPNPFASHSQITYRNIGLFEHLAPETMRNDQVQDSGNPVLDFYITTLATRQTAIRDVLDAIADAREGAVLFHCTAGKDRTGLIAALLLGLADVEEREIVSDYAQTKPLIAGLVQEFLELAKQNGTDLVSYRKLLECTPETMRDVMDHIRHRYCSVARYIDEIGLNSPNQTALKEKLLR